MQQALLLLSKFEEGIVWCVQFAKMQELYGDCQYTDTAMFQKPYLHTCTRVQGLIWL